MIRLLLFAGLAVIAVQGNLAYGHFFGVTKNVDKYGVVFAPYPAAPNAGSNSTVLNFSLLENNTNIYNVHSAVIIKDKHTGSIIDQIPYRLYEFSDMSVPYTFKDTGDYVITLQTRITGDEKYQARPLEASFDISVGGQFVAFDELMLIYVTPAAIAIAGIAIYLHSRKKL